MAESKHSSDEGACWDNSCASMQSGSVPSSPWAVTHHYSTGSHPRRAYGVGIRSLFWLASASSVPAIQVLFNVCRSKVVGVLQFECNWFDLNNWVPEGERFQVVQHPSLFLWVNFMYINKQIENGINIPTIHSIMDVPSTCNLRRKLCEMLATFIPGLELIVSECWMMASTAFNSPNSAEWFWNKVRSSSFSMFSTLGNTIRSLFNLIVVFPNEWGNSLKISEYIYITVWRIW